MNRWPYRPETLVARFERAVRRDETCGALPPEEWPKAARALVLARRDLIARVVPVTTHQWLQARRSAELTAAVLALARSGIPTDIQGLLLSGDPMRSIPPGALQAALDMAAAVEDQ